MDFTGTMDGIFGNKPKDYLQPFFKNEIIQFLWWGKEFHGGTNFTTSAIA